MGGRGSKSGGGGAGNGLSFDASKLSGSEKQKAWAKEIVDSAFRTINNNIKLNTTGIRGQNARSKEMAENYKKIGKEIKGKLNTLTNASQVIDIRDAISSSRINFLANSWTNQNMSKKNRK